MTPRDPALERELDRALLAEFGAEEIYGRLSRTVRDEELARVLSGLAHDELEQLTLVREVVLELGATPRDHGRRRRWLARALAALRPLLGQRLVLRVCADAERTRAVWYARFAQHFVRIGRPALAERCGRAASTAARHGDALDAWVAHGRS